MKTFLLLTSLLFLHLNCQEMNNTDCLNAKVFDLFKAYIEENATEIKLQERLVADTETTAKEVSFEDKYVELVQHSKFDEIIVIDKTKKIPPYSCKIAGDSLSLSAYASRFDTDQDVAARKKDWCALIAKIASKE